MLEQNNKFQHLVLSALWILILFALGKRPLRQAINFQINVIAFGDLYGTPGEDAKNYRRETTYWGEIS